MFGLGTKDFVDEVIAITTIEMMGYFLGEMHLETEEYPNGFFHRNVQIDIKFIRTNKGKWYMSIINQAGYCVVRRTEITEQNYHDLVRILGDQYHGEEWGK